MRSAQGRITPFLVRQIVLACVIASLCFSVGEGLQLRPFPVSQLTHDEATNTQFNAQESLTKYGPVNLPTRFQNRGKRQMVDFGNPPAQACSELTAHQVLLRDSGEGVDIDSVLFRFSSTGRAPPHIS